MALDFAAGCLGGAAGVVVGHPLDTVKVHLQTQSAKNPKYHGTLHCVKSLVAKEGIRGLYRGMSSPLAGVAAINAIVFGVYGHTQRNLPNPNSLASHCIAGGFAGFFQSFICSPIELAKSRLQVSNNTNYGPIECLKTILKNEGIRGVFRGLNLTIAREVPAFAGYFWSYEYLTRTNNNEPISTATMMTAGGLAGVFSWFIIYPIDVLKSRFQIDGMGVSPIYKNSIDCLIKSVKSEGYGFLFRGLTPTLIRAFPVNAACFTVVTWTMRLLGDDGIVEKVKETESLFEKYADVVVLTLKKNDNVPV